MKVGDLVVQGEKILVMKGRSPSTARGIVVDIKETQHQLKNWQKFLGRTVSVLWESGQLTENMAENAPEVVSEE